MILPVQRIVRTRIAEAVTGLYGIAADDPVLAAIPVDIPPRRALGDLAVPLAFELARRLRKAPRVIAQERDFVSINATVEVDLLGQAASETIGGQYWSGSGGQADFARGAMFSPGGQGFLVLPSTARGGEVSRIVGRLGKGSVVTTLKNTTDKVLLVADGVFQAGGLITMVTGLLSPTTHTVYTRTADAKKTKFTPTHNGFAVVGRW